jgi:hypothetical protein
MHTNLEIKTKTHCKGGGGQKSGVLDRAPYGHLARISAKFRKLFLLVFNADLATAGESATNFAGPSWRKKAVRGATGREATRVTLIELALTP